jgi:hypothetical protein
MAGAGGRVACTAAAGNTSRRGVRSALATATLTWTCDVGAVLCVRRPSGVVGHEVGSADRWQATALTAQKGIGMALGFYITGKGFTQEKYDTTLGQLEDAGAGAPDGRISHVALETNGEIQVFDIWESREAFEAFGATLIPILSAAGIELNEPMVARVHNEIKG